MPRRLSKVTAKTASGAARPVKASSLLLWLGLGWVVSALVVLGLRAASNPADPEPPTPEVMSRVDDLIARAVRDLQAERSPAAYEGFQQAAQLDPWEPRAYMGMGEAARALNYDELAIENYRRATELQPNFYAAQKSLSMGLCDFGRHEESLAVLDAMETVRPDDAFVVGERAVNLLRLGRAREAVPLFERYNELVGPQPWGLENLGRALADAGELEKAERAYREALAMNDRGFNAHLWLGQLLLKTGRREEAERHLRTFRDLREWLTRAYILEQAVNRDPEDVQLLVRLAEARSATGQYAEALVPLRRALELRPDDARLRQLYERVRGSQQSTVHSRP